MKIIEYFENLETTTEYNGYYYNVGEAVSIIIMGLLCGLENVSQIHQWAASEKVSIFLNERFGISRIPCYYWLLCLLKMIKPESMNKCFTEWVSSRFFIIIEIVIYGYKKHLRNSEKKIELDNQSCYTLNKGKATIPKWMLPIELGCSQREPPLS